VIQDFFWKDVCGARRKSNLTKVLWYHNDTPPGCYKFNLTATGANKLMVPATGVRYRNVGDLVVGGRVSDALAKLVRKQLLRVDNVTAIKLVREVRDSCTPVYHRLQLDPPCCLPAQPAQPAEQPSPGCPEGPAPTDERALDTSAPSAQPRARRLEEANVLDGEGLIPHEYHAFLMEQLKRLPVERRHPFLATHVKHSDAIFAVVELARKGLVSNEECARFFETDNGAWLYKHWALGLAAKRYLEEWHLLGVAQGQDTEAYVEESHRFGVTQGQDTEAGVRTLQTPVQAGAHTCCRTELGDGDPPGGGDGDEGTRSQPAVLPVTPFASAPSVRRGVNVKSNLGRQPWWHGPLQCHAHTQRGCHHARARGDRGAAGGWRTRHERGCAHSRRIHDAPLENLLFEKYFSK